MKVIFSHGKESGPWGGKIKALADIASAQGCKVDSIDYQDLVDEPDARVERLVEAIRTETDEVLLVGSSMGSYVALVAAGRLAMKGAVKGVFLLAPALYIPGYQEQTYDAGSAHVEIVHGWSDDVCDPANSIRYAQQAECALHLIEGDHRLNSSLVVVSALFKSFIEKMTR